MSVTLTFKQIENIIEHKLPDNGVYELETFMDYIINKYGLRGGGDNLPTTKYPRGCL